MTKPKMKPKPKAAVKPRLSEAARRALRRRRKNRAWLRRIFAPPAPSGARMGDGQPTATSMARKPLASAA